MKVEYYNSDFADAEVNQLECCGIEELYGLATNPNDNLFALEEQSSHRAMVIFHDTVNRGLGKKLVAKIRKKKLGTVISSPVVKNPNTSNDIQMWIWVPDWLAVSKYVTSLVDTNDESDWG